jgi:hypothetical protein
LGVDNLFIVARQFDLAVLRKRKKNYGGEST